MDHHRNENENQENSSDQPHYLENYDEYEEVDLNQISDSDPFMEDDQHDDENQNMDDDYKDSDDDDDVQDQDLPPASTYLPQFDNSSLVLQPHYDSPAYSVATHPKNPYIVVTGGGDDQAAICSLESRQILAKWGTLPPPPPPSPPDPDPPQGNNPDAASNLPASSYDPQNRLFTDSVTACAFSADGSLIAFGDMAGNVVVVDIISGTVRHRLEGLEQSGSVDLLAFHPKGNVLWAAGDSTVSYMWNAQTAAFMQCFAGHAASIRAGGFTPDGKLILSGSDDATVKIWNPRLSSPQVSISSADGRFHESPVLSLCADKQTRVVLSGGDDGSLFLSSIETGKILQALPSHAASVESIDFSHDPATSLAASAGMDGKLKVWDLEISKLRTEFAHRDGIIDAKWFRTNPHLIISCSVDNTIKVWDIRLSHGKEAVVADYQGHTNTILGMALLCNELGVVTIADDCTLRFFDFTRTMPNRR